MRYDIAIIGGGQSGSFLFHGGYLISQSDF